MRTKWSLAYFNGNDLKYENGWVRYICFCRSESALLTLRRFSLLIYQGQKVQNHNQLSTKSIIDSYSINCFNRLSVSKFEWLNISRNTIPSLPTYISTTSIAVDKFSTRWSNCLVSDMASSSTVFSEITIAKIRQSWSSINSNLEAVGYGILMK